MTTWLHRCCEALKNVMDLGDVIFVLGAGATIYGVAQVYPPAAWVLGGAILATAAIGHGGSDGRSGQ
jgi:hypothetical protein